MKRKVIIIGYNYEPEHIPREPDKENRFYTYGFGGNFGRHLKKYVEGYDVEVWRLDGYVKRMYEDNVAGVKYKVFPAFNISKIITFSFRFIRELKKEVKKTNPILIVPHTHYWLAYHIAYFFRKSTVITTHHGEWSPFYRVKNTSGLRKLKAHIDMFVEKRVFKYIDCILCAEFNQIDYFRKASPTIRFMLWSTGVNFDHMKQITRTEARKQLGWDENKKYILYVGKLYKFKQADEMIRAWQEIKKNRPDVELVIIGNTPNDPWEEFYQMAVDSGAMVLGRVLNSELYKYYSAADVYVLYALRDDYFGGTGIATLESMACGTPVVSYALRNYVGDNLHEIGEAPDTLEGYKEAIIKVIDNPQNYWNIRESVFKYYSYEAVFTRLGKLLEELSVKQK
jgi:glycosyltransferase involved in cell wall biosynthesis